MSASPPTPLTHDEVREILRLHALHRASSGADGREADLSGYQIEDFDFSGENLVEIHAQDSVFLRCRFAGADIYHGYWTGSRAPGADFRGAQLGKCELQDMDLAGASFDGATLVRADLSGSSLRGASFVGADLLAADLDGCDLTDACFDRARVAQTRLDVPPAP